MRAVLNIYYLFYYYIKNVKFSQRNVIHADLVCVCVTSIYDLGKFRCYLLVFIALESLLIIFEGTKSKSLV